MPNIIKTTIHDDGIWKTIEYDNGAMEAALVNPVEPPSVTPVPVPDDVKDLSSSELDAKELELQKNNLRIVRNEKLLACDWTQSVADNPLSSTKKEEWKVYRQKLRDETSGISSMDDIKNHDWPTKPS